MQGVRGCGNGLGLGGAGEGECCEIGVQVSFDLPASQVIDERFVALVSRDDVEAARGVGDGGSADVVGEGEVEGVFAAACQANQLHGIRVVDEFLYHLDIELLLFFADEEVE